MGPYKVTLRQKSYSFLQTQISRYQTAEAQQGSISSTFYAKLLHGQIPGANKKILTT